jgi:hypothetical protein
VTEWAIEEAADRAPRAEAILAAIQAKLPAGTTAYEADMVPGATGGPSAESLPARYVTIELSRSWHSDRRGDADMIPAWALTTHYRAPVKSGEGSVSALRKAVTAALENQPYDLPNGDTLGPFSFEIDGGIRFVADGWSGFDTWTA